MRVAPYGWIFVYVLASSLGGAEAEETVIWLKELAPGDRIEIYTSSHIFHFQLIDPHTGETTAAVSKDGRNFGPPARVYILGATPGRHPEGLMVVRMGCIQTGKRLELAVEDLQPSNRRLTAPVERIRLWKSAYTAIP